MKIFIVHIIVFYLSNSSYVCIHYFVAAINIVKAVVNISPSDDDVIPLVVDLQDDNIVEPTDFYQLTIVSVSDPNVVVGVVNTSFVIVNDDDELVGKIYIYIYICI